eukprot:7389224-Prymnesium_polylepis.3
MTCRPNRSETQPLQAPVRAPAASACQGSSYDADGREEDTLYRVVEAMLSAGIPLNKVTHCAHCLSAPTNRSLPAHIS